MPDKTRAQLHRELADAQNRLAEAEAAVKAQAAEHEQREARRDPEAVAFERCSFALDWLRSGERNSRTSSDGYGMSAGSYRPPAGPVERVLGYLADRFGIEQDTAGEVAHLSRRLAEAEAERDRLRAQLASIASAASGAEQAMAWPA